MDSTMKMNHVFVPDKYDPQIANVYLEQIRKRYFENMNE